MNWSQDIIFTYEEVPQSPEIVLGSEFLKITVGELSYAENQLAFSVFLSAMVPTAAALRYERLEEAMVFVVSDVDRGTSYAARSRNEFVMIPEGSESPTNLLSNPPFPLTDSKAGSQGAYRGVWVSASFSQETAFPKRVPSIFVHAVFENFSSNVVGIDLRDLKTVNY